MIIGIQFLVFKIENYVQLSQETQSLALMGK